MMMDGTQWEACSNQQDLFPVVEEVAIEGMEKADWRWRSVWVYVCVFGRSPAFLRVFTVSPKQKRKNSK